MIARSMAVAAYRWHPCCGVAAAPATGSAQLDKAIFFRRISGAEPPAGSYRPKSLPRSGWRRATSPIEPVIIAHSSDRMPNRLEHSSTSNCDGSLIKLHGGVIDIHVREFHIGIRVFATSLTISRHRIELGSTLAFINRGDFTAAFTRRLKGDTAMRSISKR